MNRDAIRRALIFMRDGETKTIDGTTVYFSGTEWRIDGLWYGLDGAVEQIMDWQ